MTARVAARPLRGAVRVGGDKSIAHRATLLAALARGRTVIETFSPAGDCEASLGLVEALGATVERDGDRVSITSDGPDRVDRVERQVDCVRSGTTMRIGAGVLAGIGGRFVLSGDEQLLRRPMSRVADPLRRMGANVRLAAGGGPPIEIEAADLRGIRYAPSVASAQVKSAVLFAGLRASGATIVEEAIPTRDHTERLLSFLGLLDGPRGERARSASVRAADVPAFALAIPGDFSSAAFLLAAAALVPGSDVVVERVGVNPTRTGFLDAAVRMGADVEVVPRGETGGESVADVRVRWAQLQATSIDPAEVPSVIDELPLVALLATQAEGVTRVRGAGELRVKETDRIAKVVAGLRALGAGVDETQDGFAVSGPTPLRGGVCDAGGDHRLAMTFAVAALIATGPVSVDGAHLVDDSFPGFAHHLSELTR